jgi:hypothetical protein
MRCILSGTQSILNEAKSLPRSSKARSRAKLKDAMKSPLDREHIPTRTFRLQLRAAWRCKVTHQFLAALRSGCFVSLSAFASLREISA